MKKMNYVWLAMICVIGLVLTACSSSGGSKMTMEAPSAPAPQASSPSADGNAGSGSNAPGLNLSEPEYYFHESARPASESAYEPDYDAYPEEEYLEISENKETDVSKDPLLTFSLKIDSASYRNVVRYIEGGNLPPSDAVRIEEMINYFEYEQELVNDGKNPFSIYTEIGPSLFNEDKNLAFVRVKSKDIDKEQLPSSNLTFLIDSSGSMNSYDKLPLLQSAFSMLVENLDENDTVSIVTYAGNAAVVLDSVRGDQQEKIINAIYSLSAGGSTAGADGILTAYDLAEKNYVGEGNNRVILATDGDFNVGVSSVSELEKLISKKRDSGVYLSILGFGTENLKDNKMETLAKNGNGNYNYIDSVYTAKKVLVDELSSNLFTIADDVKAQIEFNPALVDNYRLIGYENRRMANKDFNNDKKDAGEIGVGSDVVLMFEIELNDNQQSLKYQSEENAKAADPFSDELFEVRIRYKNPGESESHLITEPVTLDRLLERNTGDFDFAASVAGLGHLLRGSEHTGDVTAQEIWRMARNSMGRDEERYRREFVDILEKYARILGISLN